MTREVFRTKGGKAADGLRALSAGPLHTSELAQAMGVLPRRVHAYMWWALNAGAVVLLKRGKTGGGSDNQTLWGLGATPVEFGRDHRPYRLPPPRACVEGPDPLPVRRYIVPANEAPRVSVSAPVSVFTWAGEGARMNQDPG